MDETFGIKKIGMQYSATLLQNNVGEAGYDLICYVTNEHSYNGNGGFDILFSQDVCLNGWRIKEAKIGYNWANKWSNMKVVDSMGKISDTIQAYDRRIGLNGPAVREHKEYVLKVLEKFNEFVRTYPSVGIYNAIKECKSCYWYPLKLDSEDNSYKLSTDSTEKMKDNVMKCIDTLNLLGNMGDVRSRELFNVVHVKLLEGLKTLFSIS